MSPAPLTPLFYISAIKYRESLKAKDLLIAHLSRRIEEVETHLFRRTEELETEREKHKEDMEFQQAVIHALGALCKSQRPPQPPQKHQQVQAGRSRILKRRHSNQPQPLIPSLLQPKLNKSPASSEPLNQDFIRSSAGGHYNEKEGLELQYPRNLASIGNRDQQRTLSKPQQSSQHRPHFSKHHFLDLGSLNQNKTVPAPLPTVPVTKVMEPKLSKAPTDTTNITNNPVLAEANPTLISSIKRMAVSEPKTKAEKGMVANPRLNCMTTKSPYFVNECQDTMSGRQAQEEEEEELVGNNVEVPGWRMKIFEPVILPENYVEIEDLSEQAFLKRHRPFEIAEKRRKRWDSQRIREETYVQKLKMKQQERERKINRRKTAGRRVAARGGDRGESDEEMDFERPTFNDVMYIRVSDDIPISVFGSLLPISEQSTFQIPWKTKLEQENASPTVVPHQRGLRKPSSETNHSSSSASQIVMTGSRGGYSISSSSSASQSSEIKEMRRVENPALDLDEAEPTCPAPMNFAMSADRGNPSK